MWQSAFGGSFDSDKVGTLVKGQHPAVALPILEAGARTGKSTTDPRAGSGIGEPGDPMYTLQSGKQHAVAVDMYVHPRILRNSQSSNQVGIKDGAISDALTSEGPGAVAFQERGREGGRSVDTQAELAYALTAPNGGGRRQEMNVATSMACRRLSVVECARLQGFPDTYAHIPWRKRKIDAEEAAYLMGHGLECWQDGEQWFTKVAADGPMYRAYGNSMALPVMAWILNRIRTVDEAQEAP